MADAAVIRQTRAKKPPAKPEIGQDPVLVAMASLRPATVNDKLYRPVDPTDPPIIALAASIREFGLLEPLVVTADDVILSGHRRYAASRLAGVQHVRVRRVATRSDDPRFVTLLLEHNRQREKSPDERLREEIVTASRDDAYRELIQHRADATKFDAETVTLGKERTRSVISAAKKPMLDAIRRILNDMREYLPTSDRAIHYRLCNEGTLRHAGKPDSGYLNDVKSYKSLVELLTRARLAGKIPMNAIADETRPVTVWDVFATPNQYLARELKEFAGDYQRDLMRSQAVHVELLAEKNTVEPILRTVAAKYTIPLTSGRGFCSLPPRQAMSQRFKASGKDKLAIIIASDFDPEGESICESFARSMRDDFGIRNVSAVKAALTWQQTQDLKLPPALEAKAKSSRYEGFVERYGTDVYELEALQPGALQDIVCEAVRSVINVDRFNQEVDAEKDDAQWIDVTRRRLLAAMSEINTRG